MVYEFLLRSSDGEVSCALLGILELKVRTLGVWSCTLFNDLLSCLLII
jgi:hypothetical protein